MVLVNDFIQIHVDFVPITATASLDDALGLLIAMYTIFELNFPKNSRTIRFLYSVFHEVKQFLSNTIRLFLREKQIDIIEGNRQHDSAASISASAKTQPVIQRSQPSIGRNSNYADDFFYH
jgi:hypothetical protein